MDQDNYQIGDDEGRKLVGKETARRKSRRHWRADEKAGIIAESLAPGVRLSEVARRHGLSPGLLSRWRRKAASARKVENGPVGPAFVPVVLGQEGSGTRAVCGSAGIEIAIADAVIRLRGEVEAGALSMVLSVLRGQA